MNKLLETSRNGIEVFYHTTNYHAATHFQDTPGLKELVQEIIRTLELNGDNIGRHFDMGRNVGTCDVVDVNHNDKIVYGTRKNRKEDGLVPFVINKSATPSRCVSMHLLYQPNGTYSLHSAWIGKTNDDDEPFPQSNRATNRSVDFWARHAFVYGSQEIVDGTETDLSPW